MLYQNQKIGQGVSNSFIGAIPFGGCSLWWYIVLLFHIEVIRRGFSLYCGIYYYMVSVWYCIFVLVVYCLDMIPKEIYK